MPENTQPNTRVVIVGAGFAGLWAARRLSREQGVQVTLLDRNNYHTFMPLLYQVAAAELEPGQIAYPLRGIFRGRHNIRFVMGEVCGIDPQTRRIRTENQELEYDQLILAVGSLTTFFGTKGAEEHAFVLKSLEDAVVLRNHLLACFERAASAPEEQHEALLTICIIGGGPTGVEYAGALAELVHTPLARDFPALASKTRIVLVDAADEILAGFSWRLRRYANKKLQKMGVDVQVGRAVLSVTPDSVNFKDGTTLSSHTVVWTAGICGNEVAARAGLKLGRSGRVHTLPELQVEGYPEIHVAGDLSLPPGETPPPTVAPSAIQQGRHAAENVLRLIRGEATQPFKYFNKGSMVTIGRNAAVVSLGKFGFTGFFAWIVWLFVHLAYLIGFRNRLLVLINWAWDYLLAERGVRLILPKPPVSPEVCRAVEYAAREQRETRPTPPEV